MTPAKLQATLNQALAHHRSGRLNEASVLYAQVHKAAPKLFDPLHLGGTVAYQQHRYAEAVTLLTRAHVLNPRSAPCSLRLGLAFLAQGRLKEAETQLKTSLALAVSAEAWNALGLTLRALGRTSEAIDAFSKAVAVQPELASAHDQLGAIIADTQGFAAAIPHFKRATELEPKLAGAWCNLGLAFAQTGSLPEAMDALDRALSIDPNLPLARMGRGLVHQRANRIQEAISGYDDTLQRHPSLHEARSARLLCLNYLDTKTPGELFDEHRRFGEQFPSQTTPSAPIAHTVRDVPATRLKLAFLSPDLRSHSVAYFLEPLLRHLDRTRFEVILYHDHAITDAVSARLSESASIWRNFASQPDSVVETQIRKDAPDILVDLAGHTGFNRLPLFARRLAPVQITYLGYPNTTGLSQMDFRFTDAWADPVGDADRCHSEKLVRFSSCAWSYQPPSQAPAVPPLPGASGAPCTFGSFNNAAKLTHRTLDLWTKVLSRVENSRLFLKGHSLNDPAFLTPLIAEFKTRGITQDRLILAGRTVGLEAHLAHYAQVDIALDSFPYHGTTTTCEALWMGRPVISRVGDRHASRVGLSLLHAAGHPEWAAENDEDFVSCAVELANDRSALALASRDLRSAVQQGPLLQHAQQAERFAQSLLDCWAVTRSGS